MPRITEITNENASAPQRAILAAQEADGAVFNTSRIWAHRPEAFTGLMGFADALENSRTLPPGLVHLTRVRVAQINGCPF